MLKKLAELLAPYLFDIMVTRVTRLKVEPDDVLVLTVKWHISPEAHDRLRQGLKETFPNNRAIVLEEGATLGVVYAEE